MTIAEFQEKIKKEIDPQLHIRLNVGTNVNGVYWDTIYVGIALPPNEIMDKKNEFYVDPHTGVAWRGVVEAMADIRAKLPTSIRKHNEEKNLIG